ncbi:dolichyl-phosphate beta-glucosyltransferase wollknaeuel [Arctopsyche grandis]|uniref:dolichyl-phosphate beta-glucosyltransferase wollknaeuel n=1 Tax=Arctopsyche grandis TaxID=121162 RepID=UPI00406D85D3
MAHLLSALALIAFYVICLSSAAFVSFCLVLVLLTKPYPNIFRHKEEKYFKNGDGKSIPFPSLSDPPTIHLSVVVPAYEEELRLPPMLDECLEYLDGIKNTPDFQYEVIVVSDGSRDKTVAVAKKYTDKYGSEKVRVLDLIENRGKGGAVRLGMMSSRGALILFADADGATRFSDVSKLEASLEKLCGKNYLKDKDSVSKKSCIVIGSRAHLEDDAIATRSVFRTILMYGFHFLVWLFAVRGIRDTQCGFKLLTRQAARVCFLNMHVERWAFDVELLYIAQRLKIDIAEVAVNWTEIDGSKVTPVWSWIQMGADLFLIWLRYRIGAWKLRKDE